MSGDANVVIVGADEPVSGPAGGGGGGGGAAGAATVTVDAAAPHVVATPA
jgi:hypothetical protein